MADDTITIRDNREPGWFWAQNELLDEHGANIGVCGIAVYMTLARYANNESQRTWPGLRKIAAILGTGRNQVRDAIAMLEAAKIIRVTRRPRQSHIYTLITLKATLPGGFGEDPPQEVGLEKTQVGSEKTQGGSGEDPVLDLGTILTEQDEEKDFLEQTKKPDRERIQDVLYDILRDGTPPPAPKQQQVFENAVDTLVLEFREIHGSKHLDHDLTSKIIAAIRAAYEEKGNAYPFQGNRSPNTPIIDCIVDAGIGVQDQATARSSWAEDIALSQQAWAKRQVQTEERDPWWDGKLRELQGQMMKGAFDSWLKPTVLLEREGGRIVVGVPNGYAKDWLDNRLRGVIERAVVADGVTDVAFEIVKEA